MACADGSNPAGPARLALALMAALAAAPAIAEPTSDPRPAPIFASTPCT